MIPRVPRERIDADAEKVVRRLTECGFTAYLVGGCVRDLLLGRSPKDFDIATSATPQEVRDVFRNCRIIGRRFRLAHVFFGSKIIETATFRANPREGSEMSGQGAELNGGAEGAPSVDEEADLLIRRDNVFGTPEEDARRRDFTVNGLFFDATTETVIDYVDGLPDLEQRVLRIIGNPSVRLREDPVRILRAIKFSARLDFSIEPATYAAMLECRGEISKSAPPRVLEELYRLLRGGAARRSIELLAATGLLAVLVPALAHHAKGGDATWEQLLRLLAAFDAQQIEVDAAPVGNGLLLALLVAPLLPDLFGGAAEQTGTLEDASEPVAAPTDPAPAPAVDAADWVASADETLALVARQIVASRRDVEQARHLLLAQPRLAARIGGHGRRGAVRPSALVQRDYFPEALALYRAWTTAAGHEEVASDVTQAWQRQRQQVGRSASHSRESLGGAGSGSFERGAVSRPLGEASSSPLASGGATSSPRSIELGEPRDDGRPGRSRRRRSRRRRLRPAAFDPSARAAP
jgi:poly(A) polymerase